MRLGDVLGRLGASWKRLWSVLWAFWGFLGPSCGPLGALLGGSWVLLEVSRRLLGLSWGALGKLLEPSGEPLAEDSLSNAIDEEAATNAREARAYIAATQQDLAFAAGHSHARCARALGRLELVMLIAMLLFFSYASCVRLLV